MGRFDGQWVPETEAETALLMEINAAAKRAHESGVTQDDIVSAFAFLQGAYLDGETPETPAPPEPPADDEEGCPECGTEIDDVLRSMGGICQISPCGCEVDHSEIKWWFDE